jgi:hypothetical protein
LRNPFQIIYLKWAILDVPVSRFSNPYIFSRCTNFKSIETDDDDKPPVVGRGFVVEKSLSAFEGNNKHTWKERWLLIQSDSHAARQKKASTFRKI